jgi:hypothetical protein
MIPRPGRARSTWGTSRATPNLICPKLTGGNRTREAGSVGKRNRLTLWASRSVDEKPGAGAYGRRSLTDLLH